MRRSAWQEILLMAEWEGFAKPTTNSSTMRLNSPLVVKLDHHMIKNNFVAYLLALFQNKKRLLEVLLFLQTTLNYHRHHHFDRPQKNIPPINLYKIKGTTSSYTITPIWCTSWLILKRKKRKSCFFFLFVRLTFYLSSLLATILPQNIRFFPELYRPIIKICSRSTITTSSTTSQYISNFLPSNESHGSKNPAGNIL